MPAAVSAASLTTVLCGVNLPILAKLRRWLARLPCDRYSHTNDNDDPGPFM